uniref:Activated RNA polymerase II transcriptional coactivator p15 n=1 Tax=Salmo trutta TaxID=8032 RepID=A0A674E042_SALTR
MSVIQATQYCHPSIRSFNKATLHLNSYSTFAGLDEQCRREPHPTVVVKSNRPTASDHPAHKNHKTGDNSSTACSMQPSLSPLQIGKLRYFRVSLFESKTQIDIREFYTIDIGDLNPGRKGSVAWNPKQWNQLKKIIPDIDTAIRKF